MTSYYTIEPECPGHLGEDTAVDVTTVPVRVTSKVVHVEFHGWLGDDLLSAHPVFLSTKELAEALRSSTRPGLVNVGRQVRVTTSDEFREFFPGLTLPPFLRIEFTGAAGVDDFGLTPKGLLVVSDRGLDLLRRFAIKQAIVKKRRGARP